MTNYVDVFVFKGLMNSKEEYNEQVEEMKRQDFYAKYVKGAENSNNRLGAGILTYINADAKRGDVVEVPYGKNTKIGVILGDAISEIKEGVTYRQIGDVFAFLDLEGE